MPILAYAHGAAELDCVSLKYYDGCSFHIFRQLAIALSTPDAQLHTLNVLCHASHRALSLRP